MARSIELDVLTARIILAGQRRTQRLKPPKDCDYVPKERLALAESDLHAANALAHRRGFTIAPISQPELDLLPTAAQVIVDQWAEWRASHVCAPAQAMLCDQEGRSAIGHVNAT